MNAEGPQTQVIKEYTRLAGSYDTNWSFYIEATTRETIARLPLRAEDRLLDVGCGTGALLYHLSTSHPATQLVGLDPVPEMLAVARRKISSDIALHEGWAEQLPFADAQFDVVVSCSMFHYVARPLDALIEMRRVLRPGGQLVLTDWCGDYLMCRLFERYQRLRAHAHARTYRTHECARMLKESGYTAVQIETYKINWLWGLMTARGTHVQA
ncbi:class I SAM-dependent methyltransferase [Salinisphaera orenii]|uniref:Membrane protein n=1 Tax=Salinisphaera orenii YIM 95161 TaxID=1051139 RepID=A0A423PDU3_9GAMM|nr:methyltransferase domain-containing protein [Salinisphaera halophila]ROO23128.1 membrane protein [Salinisphaera halophila YIM 95161]